MRELTKPIAIHGKALLFLLLGLLAGALLIVQLPTMRSVLLLCVCVWAFCRCYYWAFYVFERYADPGFRFTGLISVIRYVSNQGGEGTRPGRRGDAS